MLLALSSPLGLMLSSAFQMMGLFWRDSQPRLRTAMGHLSSRVGLKPPRYHRVSSVPDVNLTSPIFLKKPTFCHTPMWYNRSWLFSSAKIYQIQFSHLTPTSCLLDINVHGWRIHKHTPLCEYMKHVPLSNPRPNEIPVVRDYLAILLPWPTKTQVR